MERAWISWMPGIWENIYLSPRKCREESPRRLKSTPWNVLSCNIFRTRREELVKLSKTCSILIFPNFPTVHSRENARAIRGRGRQLAGRLEKTSKHSIPTSGFRPQQKKRFKLRLDFSLLQRSEKPKFDLRLLAIHSDCRIVYYLRVSRRFTNLQKFSYREKGRVEKFKVMLGERIRDAFWSQVRVILT